MSDKEEFCDVSSTEDEGNEDTSTDDSIIDTKECTDKNEDTVIEKKIEESVKKCKKNDLAFIADLIDSDQILRPVYTDVSPLFADEVPFLVDGDSLLLTVINDENWFDQLGGSVLHLIYLFEHHLNVFVQRGGNFHLIFFNCWRNVWHKNWQILLFRLSVIHHFSKNAKQYHLHIFDDCFDEKFWTLVSNIRPGFILTNLDAQFDCDAFPNIKRLYLKYMSNIQILNFLYKELPCISTKCINVDVHLVYAFYLDANNYVKRVATRFLPLFRAFMCKSVIEECNIDLPVITDINTYDIRTLVTIIAGSGFLNETKDMEMLRVFFLNVAVMDCLELKNRCCPLLTENLTDIMSTVNIWHKYTYLSLSKLCNVECVWNTICDLWQGILFGHVCRFVNNGVDSAEQLGTNIADVYEKLVLSFNNNFNCNMNAYPIKLSDYNVDWREYNITSCTTDLAPLQQINNPLVIEFCDSIKDDARWVEPPSSLFPEQEYKEEHHYHTMKVIYDEHDHIQNTITVMPKDPKEKRRYMKNLQLHARYMTIYGSSIEGRSLESSAVIRDTPKGKVKNKKEKKQKESKKAQEIKNKNIQTKLDAIALKSKESLDKFKDLYKMSNNNPGSLLREINIIIEKTPDNCSFKIDGYMWKLKVLLRENSKKQTVINNDVKRNIFLTVRQIFSLRSGANLDAKEQEVVLKSLVAIDCLEIANRNGVRVEKSKGNSNDSWIRYQLEHLGPELERVATGKPDGRVTNFVPDPWQQKLFDVVDRRQSAVIVAPTSSGKTYASYYCMESILREGTDGIVVYVSPTKALVNQVAATIYARYKDTVMPNGRSVYGIFTRDFRTHALNCQILVTVPQCLELLLLSPRRHSWVQKLRYVIFDEVHCITNQLGGISWERCLLLIRCPFLALSATVRKPGELHAWLQTAEDYKYKQDLQNGCERRKESYRVVLVVHSERHSDLTKYTYGKGELHHLHPYSNLEKSVINVHDGIPTHILLSPLETLQLYDAMHRVNPTCEDLQTLSPATFFSEHCKNGFISRNLVREYERILSKVLEKWYGNNEDDFEATIKVFKKSDLDEIVGTGITYIQKNIVHFILCLRENNMLPAIVFCYDRRLIECMLRLVTKYFMSCEVQVDRRTLKQSDKLEKKNKKLAERIAAKEGQETTGRPRKKIKSLNILSNNGSGLQGVGCIDSNDIEFLERRLQTFRNSAIMHALRNGLAFHHGGLNNKIRSAVEMLFRMKVLNVVFATGTLALGIHMPCKTAVVAGNSPFLNSLEYHQVSGRAGRRGYDTAGNVIFLGINPRKQHTLLTAKLPMIRGSFPVTVTFILRLLLLTADVTDKGEKCEIAQKLTVSRVMALLENSLVFREHEQLKVQVKHFFCFSLQLLKVQGLINHVGAPLNWCGIATHLHYHEPGNLAFVYLLRNGYIRKICTELDNDNDIQYTLLVVLSYLFTRMPLNKSSKREYSNSKVILDPLPDYIKEALKLYNKQVRFVFDQCFSNIVTLVSADNILPITNIQINAKDSTYHPEDCKDNLRNKFLHLCAPKLICSSFAALSGNNDKNLYSENSLMNNIKQQVCADKKSIPLLNLKAELNGYAVDFYRHGILESIQNDNGLKTGADFDLLRDFMLVIKTIVVSLEEMQLIDEDDIVYKHFTLLNNKYHDIFREAFPGYNY